MYNTHPQYRYYINTHISNSTKTNKQNVEVDVALVFKRVMTEMFISPLLALFNMLHKQ